MTKGHPASEENGEGRGLGGIAFATFQQEYPWEPPNTVRFDADRELLLRMPRLFATAFGQLLHGYFAGERVLDTPGEVVELLRSYAAWNAEYFPDTVRGLQSRGTPEDRHDPVVEMHFHSLNTPMMDVWSALANGSPFPSPTRFREMQLSIALHAWGIARVRDEVLEQYEYLDPEAVELRSAQNGMLTESDLAIVLLEFCRANPGHVVLPAPPQFERSDRHDRNVDFVLIDVRRRSVLGLQAKTRVTRSTFAQYGAEGIVLIDGMIDLGNSRLVRTRPDRSARSAVPWPGLIATHYLNSLKLGDPDFYRYANRIGPKKRQAAKFTYGTVDYLGEALRHVTERVTGRG